MSIILEIVKLALERMRAYMKAKAPFGRRAVRVLLVDDDEDDYLAIHGLLSEIEGSRFDLEWVATFNDAREAMARKDHDVYLLDYHLGEHNGLELLHESAANGCKAPMILLTEQWDHEVDVIGMNAGAADYLVKGQTDAALLERSIRYSIERAKTLEALRESEERYALAVRGANDGLWDWNLITNELYFSPRWKSMLGCEDNEIGNSPEEWFSRVHPEDITRLQSDLTAHRDGIIPHFENEHRLLHKDGTHRWMLSRGLVVRDVTGKATRMAGSLSDITERKCAEGQLARQAYYDPLTNLPNRTMFLNRLRYAITHTKRREDYLFAVFFLDLDRFKVINDSLGHLAGDQLLISLARRLEACLRPGDTVARLGGDEFTIFLDDIREVTDAIRVADRILKEISLPYNLNGHEVHTTASIGIALSSTGYDRPEDLLRDADTALYLAKERGRARHEVFGTGMHATAMSRLHLEADLMRAIANHELELHYQPIFSTANRKIIGFEALLRWRHPQRGLVLPAEFIPLAEETGLILPIGEWVLRTACEQRKAWQDAGLSPVYVAVNLSARQIQQQNLPELINRVLQETGVPPEALELEITESVAMKNLDICAATLHELRTMGIRIAIDDFGTGYASLSYLKRFPVHKLKIDQSFVANISSDPEEAAITTAIIAMAHSLKLKVTAEGVETKDNLDFLHENGCDQMQGFFFSQPLPAEEITKHLVEEWSKGGKYFIEFLE